MERRPRYPGVTRGLPEHPYPLHPFTVDDLYRLGEVGLIGEGVELIDGAIVHRGTSRLVAFFPADYEALVAHGMLRREATVFVDGTIRDVPPPAARGEAVGGSPAAGVAPIVVVELFPELRDWLLALLAALTSEQWQRPTVCPGWSVKDVALHLLGGDVANLSRRRDGWAGAIAAAPAGIDRADLTPLVAALDAWNAEWVAATRRMSGRVLRELLAQTGAALHAHYRGLDLMALGEPVSWVGPDPAPVWLDVAREYTEQWTHQAQIRDAVGAPGLREPRLFAPVLATFAHALPRSLRDAEAPEGARVRLVVTGEAGGTWDAVRASGRWSLAAPEAAAAAVATVDQEDAWRLWTKGLAPEAAERAVRTAGDARLAGAVRRMTAVIG